MTDWLGYFKYRKLQVFVHAVDEKAEFIGLNIMPPASVIWFSFSMVLVYQDDEEEQRAAKSKSKKSTKSQKKAAFNPFDEIEAGGAGGDDGAGGGEDDYNPFADFMAGVSTEQTRLWRSFCTGSATSGRRNHSTDPKAPGFCNLAS